MPVTTVSDENLVHFDEEQLAAEHTPDTALKFAKDITTSANKIAKKAEDRDDLPDADDESITYAAATPDGKINVTIPPGVDMVWHEALRVAADIKAVCKQLESAVEQRMAAVADEAAALGLEPDAMGGGTAEQPTDAVAAAVPENSGSKEK